MGRETSMDRRSFVKGVAATVVSQKPADLDGRSGPVDHGVRPR